MMKIPVYVRIRKESVRECVAIVEAMHGVDYRVMAELSGHVIDTRDHYDFERRYAVMHQLPCGNKYAEEVARPKDYVQAVTHWREAYRRMICNADNGLMARGFVGVCS